MSWTSIFKRGEILTQGDRTELEAIDKSTSDLRKAIERIDREWPASGYRLDRLRDLANELAENPRDEDLMGRLTTCACMPSSLREGFQHRDVALGTLGQHLNRKLFPQKAIIHRVLKRAWGVAEAELGRVERKEKTAAQEDGVEFLPSGKIIALQSRILELRNAIETYSEQIQDPPREVGNWREILREWL